MTATDCGEEEMGRYANKKMGRYANKRILVHADSN